MFSYESLACNPAPLDVDRSTFRVECNRLKSECLLALGVFELTL